MKTAISLPDELFAQADAFARHRSLSRSALVAEALRSYMANHKTSNLTAQIDAALEATGTTDADTEAVVRQSRRRLRSVEW